MPKLVFVEGRIDKTVLVLAADVPWSSFLLTLDEYNYQRRGSGPGGGADYHKWSRRQRQGLMEPIACATCNPKTSTLTHSPQRETGTSQLHVLSALHFSTGDTSPRYGIMKLRPPYVSHSRQSVGRHLYTDPPRPDFQ